MTLSRIPKTAALTAFAAIIAFGANLGLADTARAATLTVSDFGFVGGAPVSGATNLDATDIFVTSQNTYKDPPGYANAIGMKFTTSNVKLVFSKPILGFSYTFARLKENEFFTTSLGAPTQVLNDFGTLNFVNSDTVTAKTSSGDFGTGRLLFSGFAPTNSVTIDYFTVGPAGPLPLPGNANLVSFGFAPVPLPAALPLMAAGMMAFGVIGVARKRRRT